MQLDKVSQTGHMWSRLAESVRRGARIVSAEALKQHRILFGSKVSIFSLFVWPILQLATAYYAYRPFVGSLAASIYWPNGATARSILLFVSSGMLAYIFFWSLVQSAWLFSKERFDGTLEGLFLTPANRFVLVVSNGVVALVQSVWLFLVFIIGLIFIVGGMEVAQPATLIAVFLGLLVPAVAWGTFLNSICIFLRDAGLLPMILDEPVAFVAGVRIPPFALPVWARTIGTLLPLTASLAVLRGAFIEGLTLRDMLSPCLLLAIISAILFGVSAWLLAVGEKHARVSGSLTLF